MIYYYTNRELSQILQINLARWKRWSRSFLPPDPLGGMQSGYARQYAFKDLIKVFLGGHLLSHLKLSLPESQQVVEELSPWLKKRGFFDWNGSNGVNPEKGCRPRPCRIYLCRLPRVGKKTGPGFAYLIRQTVAFRSGVVPRQNQVTERMEEIIIQSDAPDGQAFLENPNVHLINLAALVSTLVESLRLSKQ